MGAYCLRALFPVHPARPGEILQVLWSDYYGAALFGDGREVACIPHPGCWLEIVGTAETSHPKVKLLVPGHALRYTRSVFLGDRFELPGGRRVGLRHLVGFRFQLVQAPKAPLPVEEHLMEQTARDLAECVTK